MVAFWKDVATKVNRLLPEIFHRLLIPSYRHPIIRGLRG